MYYICVCVYIYICVCVCLCVCVCVSVFVCTRIDTKTFLQPVMIKNRILGIVNFCMLQNKYVSGKVVVPISSLGSNHISLIWFYKCLEVFPPNCGPLVTNAAFAFSA